MVSRWSNGRARIEGFRSVIGEMQLDIRIPIAVVELNCIVKGREEADFTAG